MSTLCLRIFFQIPVENTMCDGDLSNTKFKCVCIYVCVCVCVRAHIKSTFLKINTVPVMEALFYTGLEVHFFLGGESPYQQY